MLAVFNPRYPVILAVVFHAVSGFYPNQLRNTPIKLRFESHPPDIDVLSENLQLLKLEREKKRTALAATELAIRSLEAEINENPKSNPLIDNISYDYGFISKSSGCYVNTRNSAGESGVPINALILGLQSFQRELKGIQSTISTLISRNSSANPNSDPFMEKLSKLKLSNKAIWEREEARPPVKAPFIIKLPYLALCYMLDVLFEGNPISRFWFLETVARMPYFSYITMLHTYETLGWWRRSVEAKRVHFAEEFNEFHHLLIMESLGGDQEWAVRFFAQHSAIVYFFVLLSVWAISPSLAYNFSELIESHAVDTYAEFAESNKELLMQLPPPAVAIAYYESEDMYTFDEFQTSREKGSRRPKIRNLYDVFCNIRDDEGEHVATMAACQDPNVVVRSPNTEAAILAAAAAAAALGYLASGDFDLASLNSILDSVSSSASNTASELGGLVNEEMGEEVLEEVSVFTTIFQFLKPFLSVL
eukprot:gene6697-13579_t